MKKKKFHGNSFILFLTTFFNSNYIAPDIITHNINIHNIY